MYTWSNKLCILDYTINIIQHVLHAVHWQFTHCYISPQLSGQWVQSGLNGPSQWNDIVEILDIILRAGSFSMHLSTSILPPKHNSPTSLSFIGSMINFLYVLNSPMAKWLVRTLSKSLWTTLTATLATLFETPVSVIWKLIPSQTSFNQYGRAHQLVGGDTIHARELNPLQTDSRDMSFVRVSICMIINNFCS